MKSATRSSAPPSGRDDILAEAATWLMEMHEGPLSPDQRTALAQWRQRSPEHERAWEKAALLQEKLHSLTPCGAAVLKQAAQPGRRKAVKTLAGALVLVPTAWLVYRARPWEGEGQYFETTVGQRRELQLADGTSITLNTDSRIEVVLDATRRLVRLQRGEILVTTAPDLQQPARPFLVATQQGSLRALGTRFTVRQEEAHTEVAVFEGAVEVAPAGAASRNTSKPVLPSRMQARFDRTGMGAPQPCEETQAAWSKGLLIADRMPLPQFLAELARYRKGLLQGDAAIAGLKVSGVFPLADTDRVLSLLEQTQPVRIQRLTRYWVRVLPASASP
ncbi:FecR domain-containing protein [Herbaspirillum rubrisubalbicans]|uniref:FecR domain-containing protein n=1 Tax=Herbaspirillum rubrisubalbicans TaxID=80842 RepID=UPI00155847A6|nr:Fe2+-dicitrate sensor membrane protein [Herbaspirillum rubrisubalbicans]